MVFGQKVVSAGNVEHGEQGDREGDRSDESQGFKGEGDHSILLYKEISTA